jgi:hypothetical protein
VTDRTPLSLRAFPEKLAICRFEPDTPLAELGPAGRFFSLTRTDDELSLVLPESAVRPGWRAEKGWRRLQVRGPLDFGLTGVLASLVAPLAEAGIAIFSLSTFDTDHVLVHGTDLERAVDVLAAAGHSVEPLEESAEGADS